MKSKKYRIEFSSTEELKRLAYKLDNDLFVEELRICEKLKEMGVDGILITADGWVYKNNGKMTDEEILDMLNYSREVLSPYLIPQEEVEEKKYIFIIDKGIKEIWYDGDLVKRWKGNPLASDIALFIYEQGWHTKTSVSDEVWHKYLTKEIGRLIHLKK